MVTQKSHYHTFGPYRLGKTIGQGEFAKVKLAYRISDDFEVAIKFIKKQKVETVTKRQRVAREINILQSVHHPNLLNLMEVIETETYIGMIMEYASGGELFEYILSRQHLGEKESKRLFSQLIAGVDHLHQRGIVHRDLKLENILLNQNRNIVISDFGFANVFSDDKLMTTSCGSPCYAAPELVINDYAMLNGTLPFDDPNNPDGENMVLLYKFIMETELSHYVQLSNDAQHLVSRLLNTNPEKRAKMDEVKKHRWLAAYSYLYVTSDEPFVPIKSEPISIPNNLPPITTSVSSASDSQEVPDMDRSMSASNSDHTITEKNAFDISNMSPRSYERLTLGVVVEEDQINVSETKPPTPIINDMVLERKLSVIEILEPITEADHVEQDEEEVQDVEMTELEQEPTVSADVVEIEVSLEDMKDADMLTTPQLIEKLPLDVSTPMNDISQTMHVDNEELIEMPSTVESHITKELDVEVAVPTIQVQNESVSELNINIQHDEPTLLSAPIISSQAVVTDTIEVSPKSGRRESNIIPSTLTKPPSSQFTLDQFSSTETMNKKKTVNFSQVDLQEDQVRPKVRSSMQIVRDSTFQSDAKRAQSMDQRRPSFPLENPNRSRVSVAVSLSLIRINSVETLKALSYHSGPMDQRAITAMSIESLMECIVNVLGELGLQFTSTNNPFKLNVVQQAETISKTPSRFTGFVNRLRYIGQFGLQYNRGFDGSKTNLNQIPSQTSKSYITFKVSIHRIRNLKGLLIVDVKRTQGDIWQFKRLYNEIIEKLNLSTEI
ncbi:hypothetical protein HDV02_004321 [Globomyces sp. JEL0801]|nr:hypothetical protein HDV02_004321 [Globomyces sp. JEL0801]